MKRCLILLSLMLSLLLITACGDTDAQGSAASAPSSMAGSASAEATPEPEATPEAEPEETETPSDEPAFDIGSTAGGVYTNSYLGIGCELDDYWLFMSEDELLEFSGLAAEAFDDASIKEALQDSSTWFDMYAYSNDGVCTLNVVFENMGLVYGTVIDEDMYLELSLESLAPALESAGFENVECILDTVTFLGNERSAIRVKGVVQGLDVYETLVCIKQGNYMAVVTAVSYLTDVTDTILGYFYEVE